MGQDSPIRFTLELDDETLHFGETALERVTATTFKSQSAVLRFLGFGEGGRPRHAHVGNRAFRHTW